MKRFILLISVAATALICSTSLSAQGKFGPDSAECIKYLSYYTEYYKQKNYDSALPNWRKAYQICPPTARYSLLSNGTTLVKRLIQKNQKNPTYRAALVDSLMTLYNQRVEFWPKYANTVFHGRVPKTRRHEQGYATRHDAGLYLVLQACGHWILLQGWRRKDLLRLVARLDRIPVRHAPRDILRGLGRQVFA